MAERPSRGHVLARDLARPQRVQYSTQREHPEDGVRRPAKHIEGHASPQESDLCYQIVTVVARRRCLLIAVAMTPYLRRAREITPPHDRLPSALSCFLSKKTSMLDKRV